MNFILYLLSVSFRPTWLGLNETTKTFLYRHIIGKELHKTTNFCIGDVTWNSNNSLRLIRAQTYTNFDFYQSLIPWRLILPVLEHIISH